MGYSLRARPEIARDRSRFGVRPKICAAVRQLEARRHRDVRRQFLSAEFVPASLARGSRRN